MTNSQYIKVAEMWGWKHTSDGIWGKAGHVQFCDHDLEDEVNSWQGFGRTVEAIEASDVWDGFSIAVASYLAKYLEYAEFSLDDLFEAIHLAALEALK